MLSLEYSWLWNYKSDTLKLHNNSNVSSCYTPSYRLWNMVVYVVTLVVHTRRCTSWICLSDFQADQLVISISDSILVISCTSAYQTLVKCMGTRLTLINSTNPQSVVHSHSLTPTLSLLWMLAPFSTKNFIVSTWPSSAAQCRGVNWWGEANKIEHGQSMNAQLA